MTARTPGLEHAGRRFENRARPDGRFCKCQIHDTTTITQIAQRGECNFCVVKGNGAVGEDLLFLVAFAGKQNDVVPLGAP